MLVKDKYIGVIAALAGAVLFSIKPVLIKLIYDIEAISTLQLLTLRMLISAPFYLAILFYFQNATTIKSQIKNYWPSMTSLGFVGFYLASYLDFSGLQYISAGLERAILFLNPTIVLLLSALLFKRKIKWQQAIAILLSYMGIIIAFVNDSSLGAQENLLLGSILIFFSAFFYAVYLVGSEKYLLKIGTVSFTCYTMITAFIFIFMHFLFADSLSSLMSFELKTYVYAFLMAFFSTIIPSFLFSEGIKRIGAPNGSIIGGIGPISTIILAYFILGELITVGQLIGTILVIAGVLLVSYSLKKEKLNVETN